MKSIISPSMMCADVLHLEKAVKELESVGVEYLHMDVMDGIFVPNYTLAPFYMNAIRTVTTLPFDIHLMIERPEDKLDWFDIRRGDMISVHAEATPHIHRAIQRINAKGAKSGIALNPATPLEYAYNVIDDVDMVLIMTVNPGFAGQKLVESTLKKISKLRKHLVSIDREDIIIQVDGNVSFANAKRMAEAGANMYVAGSSSIFTKDMSVKEAYELLYDAVKV